MLLAVAFVWALYRGLGRKEEEKEEWEREGQRAGVRTLLVLGQTLGALPLSLTALGTHAINNVVITVIGASVAAWASLVRALCSCCQGCMPDLHGTEQSSAGCLHHVTARTDTCPPVSRGATE